MSTVLSDNDRRRLGATFESVADLYERARPGYIDLPESECTALLDEVRRLAWTHPDLAGRETFELPYSTVAVRSRRKAGK